MTSYAATTTNASNTITATAAKPSAVIAITVNGAAHTNGTAAAWAAGENTVVVTVTYGTTQMVYTVVVTKTV